MTPTELRAAISDAVENGHNLKALQLAAELHAAELSEQNSTGAAGGANAERSISEAGFCETSPEIGGSVRNRAGLEVEP